MSKNLYNAAASRKCLSLQFSVHPRNESQLLKSILLTITVAMKSDPGDQQ